MDADNPFHRHLDVCKQCCDEPFNLCSEGAKALKGAAETRLVTRFLSSIPDDYYEDASKEPTHET